MTMIDVDRPEVQAPVEQTEEVAAEAVIEPEQIAADDSRARPMWAKIARSAMTGGKSEYYAMIAEELGAPSIASLKESGDMPGTVRTRYRIMFTVSKSIGDNDGTPIGAEIRPYLKNLLKMNDERLIEALEFRKRDVDWDSEPPAEPSVERSF